MILIYYPKYKFDRFWLLFITVNVYYHSHLRWLCPYAIAKYSIDASYHLLILSTFCSSQATTSYMRCRRSIYLHKKYQKKLRSKSIRSFCKSILKSLEFSCNTWPKSNIYNINNNIKLAWSKFKWIWLQYQTP
jgi:hypothetical protein